MTAGRVFLLALVAMVAPIVWRNPAGVIIGLVATAVMVTGAVVSIGRDHARRQAEWDRLIRDSERWRRGIGPDGRDHR